MNPQESEEAVERVDLRRNAVGTDKNRAGGIGWTSSDETRQKAHAKRPGQTVRS
jgi:hypothetical protein